MTRAFVESEPVSSFIAQRHDLLTGSAVASAGPASFERLVSHWLDQLLNHFSLQHLDAVSTQELAAYLQASSAQDEVVETQLPVQSKALTDKLACELKRTVMRLAGVRLDDSFISMAPDIVDETSIEAVSLVVEGRQLHGACHQGQVYRKVEEFKPCHQLQAYCKAQTLSEQQVPYLITRSDSRFAVWVKIKV